MDTITGHKVILFLFLNSPLTLPPSNQLIQYVNCMMSMRQCLRRHQRIRISRFGSQYQMMMILCRKLRISQEQNHLQSKNKLSPSQKLYQNQYVYLLYAADEFISNYHNYKKGKGVCVYVILLNI